VASILKPKKPVQPMKRISLILIFTQLLLMTANAQPPEIPGKHHWKHRILLVFSEAPANAQLQQQSSIIAANQEGMKDRHMVVYRIYQASVKGPDNTEYGAEGAKKLRNQYGIQPGAFAVVLIGKDGGEKHRQTQAITADALFAIIDAMPMRKSEMRRQNQN